MGKTTIEWTDMSINPIRARDKETGAVGHYCQKISSGCAHCYASRLQRRFRMPEFGGVKPELPENIEVFLDESKLEEVLRRKKPTKYFWCDMTDMFGDWVPDTWIDFCTGTMVKASQHVHQILTKRPERAAMYFADLFSKHGKGPEDWPPNIWLGTSVENQEQADKRIPELLKIPAAVRFLSCEPLLGALDLQPWFVKQLGSDPLYPEKTILHPPRRRSLNLKDKKGGDPSEWPEDLRVREFPESVAAGG